MTFYAILDAIFPFQTAFLPKKCVCTVEATAKQSFIHIQEKEWAKLLIFLILKSNDFYKTPAQRFVLVGVTYLLSIVTELDFVLTYLSRKSCVENVNKFAFNSFNSFDLPSIWLQIIDNTHVE